MTTSLVLNRTESTNNLLETMQEMKKQKTDQPWHQKTLSIETAFKKMLKNSEKALTEHEKISKDFYVKKLTLPSIDALKRKEKPLSIQCAFAAEKGRHRKTMEDAHFQKELEKGFLAGVFDGHGGKEVAEFACKEFERLFPDALEKFEGNVRTAYERVIYEIHSEIAKKKEWEEKGSTACICYIDREKHLIYTATLGDSEAKSYVKKEKYMESIPLSCVRDWMSVRDKKRLVDMFGTLAENLYSRVEEAKKIRSSLGMGVNVSRAFGDAYQEVVIQKPKITVSEIKPGNFVVMGCDGIWDYMSENDVIDTLLENPNVEDSAKELVDCALNTFDSKDNVTAGVLRFL